MLTITNNYLILSLFSSITIPGVIFYSIIESYPPIYFTILIAHFIYTFALLKIASIRTNNSFYNIISPIIFISLTEIVLSAINIPISYTYFLNNLMPFDFLLPYFGSEISMGILVGIFSFFFRISSTFSLIIFSLAWLVPISEAPVQEQEDGIRVALIQTVLPQRTTSYPGISGGLEYWKTHLMKALNESSEQQPDLIILPESSMPSFSSTPTPVVQEILNSRGPSPIIAHHYVDIPQAYGISSQARFWSSDYQLLGHHEKRYPLPMAEKLIIPGQEAFFSYKGLTLAPFVCSESLHIYRTRFRLAKSDAGIILANEAGIAHTYLPEFHFISDRIRARELGKPILRAANIRLSSYIDGHGKPVDVAEESTWENLYIKLTPGGNSFFSKTFVTLHVAVLIIAILLLYTARTVCFYQQNTGIYILILICIIHVQIAYGYDRFLSYPSEKAMSFYMDDYFPARQLGVTDGTNMETFNTYIDSSYIPIRNIPISRGVGIVNTINGKMYITERSGNYITTLSERGFLTLDNKHLEDISISDVLWYTYKPEKD